MDTYKHYVKKEFESAIKYLIDTYYQYEEEIKQPFSLNWLLNGVKEEFVELIRNHFNKTEIESLKEKLIIDTQNLLIKIKHWIEEYKDTCFKNRLEISYHCMKRIAGNITFKDFKQDIEILSIIKIREMFDFSPNEQKDFIENITNDIRELNGTLNHIISWNIGSIAMHNENRKKIHDEIALLIKPYLKGRL